MPAYRSRPGVPAAPVRAQGRELVQRGGDAAVEALLRFWRRRSGPVELPERVCQPPLRHRDAFGVGKIGGFIEGPGVHGLEIPEAIIRSLRADAFDPSRKILRRSCPMGYAGWGRGPHVMQRKQRRSSWATSLI